MRFLILLHGHMRWLVVLAALAAIVMNAVTWLKKDASATIDRVTMGIFTGLMDLQFTLGIIIFVYLTWIAGAGLPRYRLEHAGTMLIALVLAHAAAAWKRKSPSIRARNNLIVLLVSALLIFVAVMALPNGWGS